MLSFYLLVLLFENLNIFTKCDLLDDPNKKIVLKCSNEKYEIQKETIRSSTPKSEWDKIVLVCIEENNEQQDDISRTHRKLTQKKNNKSDIQLGITNATNSFVGAIKYFLKVLNKPYKNVSE